jgi:hypothetical protein
MLEPIPVCLKDNRIIYTRGIVHYCWTIGPAYSEQFGFTAGAWSIRSADTGMCVATFTDLKVAAHFAEWLMRTYGDIRQTLIRCYEDAETPEDAAILDAVHARAEHESRLRPGKDVIRFIPFRG